MVEWDKLPAEIEAPGFKKSTGEFTFTIVTPKKYEGHAKAFMDRVNALGVFFFVPCSLDQIDALLSDKSDMAAIDRPPLLQGKGSRSDDAISYLVPVEVMAEVLGVDPRTVQLDAEKGALVRSGRGQYDVLASCGSLRKAWKDAESVQGNLLRDVKLQREQERLRKDQRKNAEEEGKLTNTERLLQAESAVQAQERNGLLNMPKLMGAIFGAEVEIAAMDWVREHLKSFSSREKIMEIIKNAPPIGTEQKIPAKKKEKRKKHK